MIAAPTPIGVADSDFLLIFPPSMSSSLSNLTPGSDFVVAFCTGRDVEDYCVAAFMTCRTGCHVCIIDEYIDLGR